MSEKGNEEPLIEVDYDRGDRSLHELGDFLKEHYEKFAIMGIFGTVTVFLQSRWPTGSESLDARVGTAASLFIFALASLWVAWRASVQIGVKARSGNILGIATFGYAVIFVSSLFLGLAIIDATFVFPTASRFLGEFIIVIVIFTSYIGIHPRIKPQGEEISSVVALISFLPSIYLVQNIFYTTLKEISANIVGFELEMVSFVTGFVVFHFIIYESLLGGIALSRENMNNLRNRITAPWAIRTSILLSVIAVGLLTIWTKHVAQTTVGPNAGYYAILGMNWTQYTLGHWFSIAIIYSLPIIFYPDNKGYLARSSQIFAIMIVVISLMESILVIPKGTLVIPI